MFLHVFVDNKLFLVHVYKVGFVQKILELFSNRILVLAQEMYHSSSIQLQPYFPSLMFCRSIRIKLSSNFVPLTLRYAYGIHFLVGDDVQDNTHAVSRTVEQS